mgnify:CR=1 FL=1
MRKLNWANIIHGICFLAIIAAVMMIFSVDWGELII